MEMPAHMITALNVRMNSSPCAGVQATARSPLAPPQARIPLDPRATGDRTQLDRRTLQRNGCAVSARPIAFSAASRMNWRAFSGCRWRADEGGDTLFHHGAGYLIAEQARPSALRPCRPH